jgi:hypothetical protein
MKVNPYKPPAATLETGPTRTRRGVWWKIYFWIILISQIIYSAALVAAPDAMEANTFDYIDAVIYGGVLPGLYGFAYCKRILNRKIWQFFFPFNVIWDIWSTVATGDWDEWKTLSIPISTIIATSIILFVIPQYVALFRYGFREQALWAQGDNNDG